MSRDYEAERLFAEWLEARRLGRTLLRFVEWLERRRAEALDSRDEGVI